MLPHQPHTNFNLVQILKQLCPLNNIKLYVLYSQMFSMSSTTPDSLDHLSRSVGVISVKEELQTDSVEVLALGPKLSSFALFISFAIWKFVSVEFSKLESTS